MREFLKKLTSRKFLLAFVCAVSGLALALGAEGSEIERIVETVGGIVAAAGSIEAYINGESKIDAAAVERSGDGESK